MATKSEKKEYIRKQIIAAARSYRDNLAGKVFLYVVGKEYFEVAFQTNCFMHLTGVNSNLSARDFYKKAKSSLLSTDQFYFDKNHSHSNAKKKLCSLLVLHKLTTSIVCAVKDIRTVTLTYRLGLTNIDFTIGLTENVSYNGNKINDWFLPRTLRVNDSSIENSTEAELVDFIFSRDASVDKYDTINYSDKNKTFPNEIIPMLSENIQIQNIYTAV